MTMAALSAWGRNLSVGWDVCERRSDGQTHVRVCTSPSSPRSSISQHAPPPARSWNTDGRAWHLTAHQDDAAALLRIRFMWMLCFGSYMILLPSGVINDDDIYWRPVVLFMWLI